MDVTISTPNFTLGAIDVADLKALLDIAAQQMDCIDEDEAEGYGITLDEAERLRFQAQRLLGALLP